MKRINFILPEPVIDKLKKIKKDTGVPHSETVRRALRVYFQIREEKQQNKEKNYYDEVV